ncbi:hypothetical protein RchiOBHm_Chr2g0147261 [Rosa chinensis]|uniref:Uncharacterized protein n=1 Tax=Rosa chinensis TaxID=74649 RepID=A0A2P6RZ33_ROSCH|nr:hypothetical protein RchiOBHm_Chr2g0147261 [Rosa chinensis]
MQLLMFKVFQPRLVPPFTPLEERCAGEWQPSCWFQPPEEGSHGVMQYRPCEETHTTPIFQSDDSFSLSSNNKHCCCLSQCRLIHESDNTTKLSSDKVYYNSSYYTVCCLNTTKNNSNWYQNSCAK